MVLVEELKLLLMIAVDFLLEVVEVMNYFEGC